MNNSSHNKLIKQIKKGNSKAFATVYKEFYSNLCKYVTNFTNDSLAAEDIVQDILMKLWDNRSNLNVRTSLKNYLYKASYFEFIDCYRKKQLINENLEEIRYVLMNNIAKDDNLGSEERKLKLRKAIEVLPSRCKEIFIMSKYEGYKYKEIAEHLGLSPKTVENQIGIAYATLKTLLK